MERCEEFEVAIEMRLHGALDADGERVIEAHLSTCGACRDFETLASNTEETMRSETEMALDTMDWTRFEGSYRRWLRTVHVPWWRYALAVVVGAGAATLAQWTVLEGRLTLFEESGVGAGAIIGAIVGLVLMLAPWRRRRLLAEAREAEQARETLVALCCRQLDRQIALEGRSSWALLPIACLPWVGDAPATALGTASSVVYTLAFLGLFAYLRWQVLPRLRRERAELE